MLAFQALLQYQSCVSGFRFLPFLFDVVTQSTSGRLKLVEVFKHMKVSLSLYTCPPNTQGLSRMHTQTHVTVIILIALAFPLQDFDGTRADPSSRWRWRSTWGDHLHGASGSTGAGTSRRPLQYPRYLSPPPPPPPLTNLSRIITSASSCFFWVKAHKL